MQEYGEVDRRRNMAGRIMRSVPLVEEELPAFGWAMRDQYFAFQKGYTNVNHGEFCFPFSGDRDPLLIPLRRGRNPGSYGAPPLPVLNSFRSIQDESNAAPDEFMRITYMPKLVQLRTRLADFVGCDRDDLVMVPNATSGVNVVLRSLTTEWKQGDKLLFFSTTMYVFPALPAALAHQLNRPPPCSSYDACSSTLQYIIDTHPHLSLSLVPIEVEYPISHSKLLQLTRETILRENAKGNGKVRLGLVDALSSNPGVIVPWEDLVVLFKELDVIRQALLLFFSRSPNR